MSKASNTQRHPWCIKCRTVCKRFGLFGRFRVQRWRCRVCLATFSSGATLRAAYTGRSIRKPEAFAQAKELFLVGYSARRVSVLIGIHKNTSFAYQKIVASAQALYCGCERPYAHKGCCPWRISVSPDRQLYLARCAALSATTRLARASCAVSPLMTTWPFVRAFDGDDYALMKIVNDLVPRTIPELVRQDVCQDILLDVVSGKLFAEEIATRVSEYIKWAFKFVPSKFGPMSLDDAIYSEGRETYADRLIG